MIENGYALVERDYGVYSFGRSRMMRVVDLEIFVELP
jgi:hypothetical protein